MASLGSSPTSNTGHGFNLGDVYQDTLRQLKKMADNGRLSQSEYDTVTQTQSPGDVIHTLQHALEVGSALLQSPKSRVHHVVEQLLLRLERFGSAIDVVAQSSPNFLGVNPVGLIWGSLKFVLIVVQDVISTFDTVLDAFEDITDNLPVLETYVTIFGSTELEFLRKPLTFLYADLMAFGIKAVTLLDRGKMRTLPKASWKSLKSEFAPILANIKKQGKKVDRLAQIEHMSETGHFQKIQIIENEKAAHFRDEIRSMLTQVIAVEGSSTSRIPSPVIHAPTDLLSTHFLGREQELDRLQKVFSQVRDKVPSRAAIWGMPGLGKTQLALKYGVSKFINQYTHIFWISAATTSKLYQGYENILCVLDSPERFSTEQQMRVQAVKRWLENETSQNERTWLLVFDNANDTTVDALRDVIPKSNPRGNILFTTRNETVAQALASGGGEQHYCEELCPLNEVEAAKILLQSAGMDMEPLEQTVLIQAVDLVKSLGCLPLAVSHAASFMKQSRLGIADVVTLLNSEEKTKILNWKNKLSDHEESSVTAAFTSSFLALNSFSSEVGNFLRLLSFLDPESISIDMLVQGTRPLLLPEDTEPPVQLNIIRNQDTPERKAKEHGLRKTLKEKLTRLRKLLTSKGTRPESLQDIRREESVEVVDLQQLFRMIQSPVDLQVLIGKLHALSLVSLRAPADRPQLWIHDLVQYLIQYSVTTHVEREFWTRQTIKVIASAFEQVPDPEDYNYWNRCELYVPHVIAVSMHAEKYKVQNLELYSVLETCSKYLLSRGSYSLAMDLCKQALRGAEQVLGKDHLRTLSVVGSLAWTSYRIGQPLSDADALYRRTLKGRQAILGPNHPDTLSTMNELGIICEKEGLYDEAETFLNAAMLGREREYGEDHPKTCLVKRNIGFLYFRRGLLAEAERYSLQALVGQEEHLGMEDQETIATAMSLVLIYEKLGKYTRAEELALRGLTAREKQLGPEHPRTLLSVNNLALIYEKQGKYAEAETLSSRALAGREMMLGVDHPRTLLTVQNLATLYEKLDRLDEAEELCKRVLNGREKHFRSDHVDPCYSRTQLASIYERQGRRAEAKELCESVLQHEDRFGPKHPVILMATQNMGTVALNEGRLDEAEELFSNVLARSEEALGIGNPQTLLALRSMGSLRQRQGRLREAEVCFVRVAEQSEISLGSTHPDSVLCLKLRQDITVPTKQSEEEKATNDDVSRSSAFGTEKIELLLHDTTAGHKGMELGSVEHPILA